MIALSWACEPLSPPVFGYFEYANTEAQETSVASLPDFISQPFSHGCVIKSRSGLGTRLSDVSRIRRHGTAVLSTVKFTIDLPDTGTRPDSGHLECTEGLPCR